ncbi:MAG: hypothetical protein BGO69_18020 [Bacteroidetes bacterium 46-16]|nr:MAG: hypothetical protein BGO69_18020 [Bacteroidetes bacterium 46-16]
MKRYFNLLAAAVLLFSFSSCKKDYTCQCVDAYSQKLQPLTVHDTKKNAKESCKGYNVGTAGQAKSITCKLL